MALVPTFIAHPPGNQDPDTKRQFDQLQSTLQTVQENFTYWAGPWNGGCYEAGAIVTTAGCQIRVGRSGAIFLSSLGRFPVMIHPH